MLYSNYCIINFLISFSMCVLLLTIVRYKLFFKSHSIARYRDISITMALKGRR